jgi:hypothetical protein
MATISAKRRPIRDGAERSNEFNRCMSPILSALAEPLFREESAELENGPASEECREHGENSNAAIVRRLMHSRFVAATGPAGVEFSLAEIAISIATSA